MSDLREYLAANMFDGDGESGVMTAPIKTHLDTIVELVTDWEAEARDELRKAVAAMKGWPVWADDEHYDEAHGAKYGDLLAREDVLALLSAGDKAAPLEGTTSDA